MSHKMIDTSGYATMKPGAKPEPFKFQCKPMGLTDVHIKVKFVGICSGDLHFTQLENGIFPMVPGHEIAGIVEDIGADVAKYKKGDRVGVGCFCWSCRSCEQCNEGAENYCKARVMTYNSLYPDGTPSRGGYAKDIVVNEDFVCRIPDNLELDVAAPLLCAGITTYSPIKYYKLDKPGMKVGVLGLGGLGHVAVRILKALGSEVTVISRSNNKKEEAINELKADHYIASSDPSAMEAAANSLDGLIDTVGGDKDMSPLLNLLKVNGRIVMVGAGKSISVSPLLLLIGRKSIGGTAAGGIRETQEMLDFCSKHNITATVEKISASSIPEAYDRVAKGDVKFRFVIDASTFG